ncbi:sensor histidine kinase [Pontibacter amylolyticus]|uniref:histidine kinase n=1 Tax=Pontibacter amylolyticus TaxID=1424080 RepID=A0ABQ1WDN9_9BACT|nr:HAMP domain-containing sensor histidine kinase [Pontibacter amylolyticus]GGG27607.1 two-component sensor histidine kinase [Pontibacter amylolyticus]
MTFRTKLALSFTLLFAAIFCITGIVVYYFSERYTKNEFHERLHDRAHIAAQLYLDEDELSPKMMQRVREQYTKSLPEEQVHIYDSTRQPAFKLGEIDLVGLDDNFDRLDEKGFIEFTTNKRQWVGWKFDDNQGQFYVLVSAEDLYGQSKLVNLGRVLLISFLGSLALVIMGGRVFTRQVVQPINDIVWEVNKIRASNLHLRLKEQGRRDEIGNLVHTFNKMLNRLEMSFEMQKNFISNASHELRNPITAISGEIEVTLSKKRSPEEYIQSLESMQRETERLKKLTSDLLGLAQTGFDGDTMPEEQLRIDEVLMECLSDVRFAYPEQAINLDLQQMPSEAGALEISGNKSLLQIAVTNILENAIKFSNGDEVTIYLAANEQGAKLIVKDKGIGIPEQEQPHIFQTFYRATNARSHQGSGIGLSLTEKIMKLHDGSIEVASAEGSGTQVTLYFPGKV